MRAVFVTLEGGEGAGKTTQLALLAAGVEGRGWVAVTTREPGGTPLGARVRELLVRLGGDPPTPLAELLLYAADRAHHVETVIRPGLAVGRAVLCDRYADATEAYQGYGRGLPLAVVREVNRLATGGLRPHRTVVLDLSPEEGVRRSLERQRCGGGPREERFEAEAVAFHERVRAGYRAVAREDPERVRIVDASGTPVAVAERVWAEVEDLFARPGGLCPGLGAPDAGSGPSPR
ncbi:MAG: dTMP kinase [Deferrisomatales bacterium]|nr:dTMP kinase [Deferrisomatales bacterium]